LHHVLSEVLTQPWWLLAEALERSGFDEIQDVLLMNEAERDTLTFLDTNGNITPLVPPVKKDMLLKIKLFTAFVKKMASPSWIRQKFPRLSTITSGLLLHVGGVSKRLLYQGM